MVSAFFSLPNPLEWFEKVHGRLAFLVDFGDFRVAFSIHSVVFNTAPLASALDGESFNQPRLKVAMN